ncbi:MAG: SusC/RagA family TonB-linked outer membrane protein [Bacteroidales bacterium]|nr:SusC/RagA family TonB-linked outer membrane protein [Bacteroidales bacterium]
MAAAVFVSSIAFAQNGATVKGRVTDSEGQPLVGVAVTVLDNQTVGVITDIDGNYQITVPAGSTSLVYDFIGMESCTEVIGGRTVINVSLKDSALFLDGVVVTALGIKRAERSVTYNVQKLDESAFAVRQVNLADNLAGKLAGVQVSSSSAGIGSETKVVMRGAKSIASSNNALYVLDGIPLPELSMTTPGDSWSIYDGSRITGDGISNFNPEDFGETSVLVGPSSAALYGYKAANGILMLSTRTAKKGGVSVSYANNTTFSTPLILPRLQSSYGAKVGSYESWGTKLTTPQQWSIKDFFQTGYNTQNSISLSVGGDISSTYVSASITDAQGIIPNNKYGRKNFTVHHTADFLKDRMHLSLLGMYINVKEQNMTSGGQYYNPLIPIYLMSPSDDLQKYAVFERYDSERKFPVQYWSANKLSMQNPFWIVNRNMFNTSKDRFLIGGSLSFDITDWLDIQGRARMDFNSTTAEQKNYASTNALFAGEFGRYYYNNYKTTQTYADVLANVHKTFGDNLIQLNATLGASIEDYRFRSENIGGDLLGVANLFTFTNMETGKEFYKNTYSDQTQSVFATLQVGFKNYLFLDVTARNDWSSAMASAKTGVISSFYPSVGLSAIITDMFTAKSDIIPYAKLRVSFAGVGNPVMRFILNPTYAVTGGVPADQTWAVADNFRPEYTKSYEAGADIRMFKGKLAISGTVYYSQTSNQVFSPTISGASTASTLYINAGRIDNKGIELTASFNQDLGRVNWNTSLIYTRNVNKIVTLLDADYNGEHYRSTQESVGGTSGVKMWLTEGGRVGDLYVSTLKTDEHGFIWTSPTGGAVVPAPNDGTPATMIYAGNTEPEWTGSWNNVFSWNGLSLSALITARIGGIGVSLTEATLDAYGMSERTAIDRDNGGVVLNARHFTDPEHTAGLRVGAQQYYEVISGKDGVNAIGAYYVYSMTNVRLAEVTLGYDIPVNKWVRWMKGLNVAFVGRNLAMLYGKAPFDPAQISSTGNYGAGIDLFMMPSTRNIGFSVKVTF